MRFLQAQTFRKDLEHAAFRFFLIIAVIAFLDESVINSALPMFSDWARRPMQEEIFGDFLGGEVFFDKLRALLARPFEKLAEGLF